MLVSLLMKSWSVQSNNVREKLTKKFWVNLATFLLIRRSNNESCPDLSSDPSCARSNWFLKLLNRSQLLSATKSHQLKKKIFHNANKLCFAFSLKYKQYIDSLDLYHQKMKVALLFRLWLGKPCYTKTDEFSNKF